MLQQHYFQRRRPRRTSRRSLARDGVKNKIREIRITCFVSKNLNAGVLIPTVPDLGQTRDLSNLHPSDTTLYSFDPRSTSRQPEGIDQSPSFLPPDSSIFVLETLQLEFQTRYTRRER